MAFLTICLCKLFIKLKAAFRASAISDMWAYQEALCIIRIKESFFILVHVFPPVDESSACCTYKATLGLVSCTTQTEVLLI